jgi:hypothetical protein
MHGPTKVKHTLLVLDVDGIRIGIRNFDGFTELAVQRVVDALLRHKWLKPGQAPKVIAERHIRKERGQA